MFFGGSWTFSTGPSVFGRSLTEQIVLGIVFGLFGLGFLCGAAYVVSGTREVLSRAVEDSGVVRAIDGGHAVVEFRDGPLRCTFTSPMASCPLRIRLASVSRSCATRRAPAAPASTRGWSCGSAPQV